MKIHIQFSLVLFVFFTLSFGQAYSKWQNLFEDQEPFGDDHFRVEVLSSNSNVTEVVFKLRGFEEEEKIINGQVFKEITVPGLSLTDLKGYPELPRWNGNVLVPGGSEQVEIVDVQVDYVTYDSFEVVPSKGTIMRNQIPSLVPYTFSFFYSISNDVFPQSWVSLAESFIFRKTSGVNLSIRPFRFDIQNGQLLVARTIQFKVLSQNRSNYLDLKAIYKDSSFRDLYKKTYINIQNLTNTERIQPEHIVPDYQNLLIVTHDDFISEALFDFIDWKQQRGIDVQAYTISEIGGGWKDIEALVKLKYENEKISTLILIGDSNFVPFRPGLHGNVKGVEGDPLYGAIVGNDVYPEVVVSRLSVQTVKQLETVVDKIITYEKNPEIDGQWYSKATGIASAEPYWGGEVKDYDRAELLRKTLEGWHYTYVDKIYDPSATNIQVSQALNEGRGFVNYIGHGEEESWLTSDFRNSDISRLKNGYRTPFIVSVACLNGQFHQRDSFAEQWLAAGSQDDVKGAVAVFASSTNQSWIPPTIGQKEIVNLLASEQMNTIGMLFAHGAIAVLEDKSDSAEQTFESWIIFGDATMMVRTQAPKSIVFAFSAAPVYDSSFEAFVGEPGITLAVRQNGRLKARGQSNKQGIIRLEHLSEFERGEVELTLTGFNKIPEVLVQEI